jgi:hypothetical protein
MESLISITPFRRKGVAAQRRGDAVRDTEIQWRAVPAPQFRSHA